MAFHALSIVKPAYKRSFANTDWPTGIEITKSPERARAQSTGHLYAVAQEHLTTHQP